MVWHKQMPPSTAFFAWRLCNNKTPTSLWIQSRGIQLPSACPLCLRDEESELHLFFLCPDSTSAWSWLLTQAGCVPPAANPSVIWSSLTLNCGVKKSRIMGVLFFVMSHSIWKVRNNNLHHVGRPSTVSICALFSEEVGFILTKLSNPVNSIQLRSLMQSLGVSSLL